MAPAVGFACTPQKTHAWACLPILVGFVFFSTKSKKTQTPQQKGACGNQIPAHTRRGIPIEGFNPKNLFLSPLNPIGQRGRNVSVQTKRFFPSVARNQYLSIWTSIVNK
jgi:hypothetical protein